VGNVLGITIDPTSDPATQITLYLAYSVDNTAPFNGRIARAVSIDGGVTYTVDENFITGLARSSFDHQTNGLDFGPDGCLYIAQGNNSNAGYDADHAESRLSSAILRACFKDTTTTVDPAFDGNCGGGTVAAPDGNTQEACDVEVYAAGLRNPYDLVWHSNGRLYNADNDANPGFRDNCGAEANNFGCGCEVPTITPVGDELNLIQQGKYYGSPNPYRAMPGGLQCNGGTDGGDSCSVDADCGGGGSCVDLSALCTDSLCGEAAQCFYFGDGEPPGVGEDPRSVRCSMA
jgi:glucose/arabinose dehydrogenase